MHELTAIKVPTAKELDEYWFRPGGIDSMITNTATFLMSQGKVGGVKSAALYAASVNRTYLDEALEFSPPVNLRGLLKKRIHLAVLIPISGFWQMGVRIAGAAALAVANVNADKTLLPGRRLEFSWEDSGCSASQGLAALGGLLGAEIGIDGLIGPGCSSACVVTSHLAATSLPQISYSWYYKIAQLIAPNAFAVRCLLSCVVCCCSSSPILSDKTEFKLVRACSLET